MIPFASQRALGQDLATHLLNAHDNEYVELAEVRGAVADDIHGAFAEWEAQAHALTKCQNYLYSLSVNPDHSQGSLTREQYFDYIDRVEEKLGLTNQPRAVVFHIKHDREHCHVAWSRVDLEQEKAVQLAFDHQKLMMVTREFARDHDLELPDGYFKGRSEKGPQLSLYEMHQKRTTGLSREEHQEQVTDAWRASDSPKVFVQALAERGYILATGKRPYVLVDLYGGMHALPKLIGDKSVRTKDIRAFLEKEFPLDSLPSVEDAKKLAAQHRQALEDHTKAEQRAEKLAQLKRSQAARRRALEEKQARFKQKQHRDRLALAATQKAERDSLRNTHLVEMKHVRQDRARQQPSGLAKFFGRVSGMTLLRKSLQKYRDRKRTKDFLAAREYLKERQDQERLALQRRQDMQALDMQRKVRALEQVEKRELRSLEELLLRDTRIQTRGGREKIPSLALNLKPRGRRAMPHKAKNRYTSQLAHDQFKAAGTRKEEQKEISLTDDFFMAAHDGRTEGEGQGSSEGNKPASQSGVRRYGRKRKRGQDLDRGR